MVRSKYWSLAAATAPLALAACAGPVRYDPPTTVALAFIVFGESLTGLQLAGAALVLGAAVSLNLRPRRGAAGPLPA